MANTPPPAGRAGRAGHAGQAAPNSSRRRALRAILASMSAPLILRANRPPRAETESPAAPPFHHLPNGTFRNNHIGQIDKPLADLVRWRREAPGHPPVVFPTAQPDFALLRDPERQTVTWIGHATLLLQIAGLNILADPHFSMRASPFSFAGPRRSVPPVPQIADLPEIHAVVISHNHYDHLDSESIRALAGRFPRAVFFCPLKLGEFLRSRGAAQASEMDWGETREHRGVRFAAEPCQHWSSRFPWDRNKTLWASWVVEAPGARFLFIGDTGYSPDFAALGARYGGFDWAAIPIGAYAPRWFMRQAHISPEESVRVFAELGAANAVAIHWGTFPLTDERMDEPPERLRHAARAAGIQNFHIFRHGETRPL